MTTLTDRRTRFPAILLVVALAGFAPPAAAAMSVTDYELSSRKLATFVGADALAPGSTALSAVGPNTWIIETQRGRLTRYDEELEPRESTPLPESLTERLRAGVPIVLHLAPFAGGTWLLMPDSGEVRLYHAGEWHGPFRPNLRFAAGAARSADELLLNTPFDERPFAVYRPEGDSLRPFGAADTAPHPELRDEYNSWVLGATADGWVAAHRFQPWAASFSRTGELRWRTVVSTPVVDRLAREHADEISKATVDPSGCCISAQLVHLAESLQVTDENTILINYSASPRIVELEAKGKVARVIRLGGEGVRALDRFGFADIGERLIASVDGALRVFQPSAGTRLQGRVVDEEGQPISKATVTMTTSGGALSAETAEDGLFWLARSTEAGKLAVAAEGFLRLELAGFAAEILEHDLVLRPEPKLCLQVVDQESGEPVLRFTASVDRRVESITSVSTSPGPSAELETETGRACLEAPFPPPFLLAVTAEGYARWERRVTGLEEVEVELGPAARLTVNVRSSDDAPIAEATASLVEPEVLNRAAWSESFGARADEQGEVHLEGVPPGSWMLIVRHPNFLEDRQLVELEADDNEAEVVLSTGSRALVRVTDSRGNKIHGARAILAPVASVSAIAQECVTDPEGTCLLSKLLPGGYVLGVDWREGARTSRRVDVVAANEVFDVEVPSDRISGRLYGMERYGDAEFAVRLRVGVASRLDAAVDPAGRFVFEGAAEPGTWAEVGVHVLIGGGEPWEAMRTTVRLPGEDETLELELPEPIEIFGQVTEGGRSCAWCDLELRADPGAAAVDIRRTTAADGSYRALLPAPGNYLAEVDGSQQRSRHALAVSGSGRYDIELEGGTITGRVVHGEDGAGVEQAEVVLRRGDGSVVENLVSTSDGGFRFSGLDAGNYHLSAQVDEAIGERHLSLAAGAQQEVRLELARGETLRLRLIDGVTGATVGRGSFKVYDASGRLVAEQLFRGFGSELVVPVPSPGPFTIVVRAHGFGLTTVFDVSPSETARTVALRPPATLVVEPGSGTTSFALLDSAGRPIAVSFDLPPGAVPSGSGPLLLRDLSAGPHVLAADGTGRRIELIAGEQTVIEF